MDLSHLGGWINDHPSRPAIHASVPDFAIAANHLMYANAPDTDYLLYKAWKDVLGAYPDYPAQQIGDCESFGNSHAIDLLQCIDIATHHAGLEYKEICTEATYAFGREAGNMLGLRDGCYGSAMAKALTTIGAVPRELVGSYDGERAKSWGYRGAPENIKAAAKDHVLGDASLVDTLDKLDAALATGYPVPVSSNWGFTLQRDQDGFCQPSGTWNHCMLIAAKRVTRRRGYLICQSWGNEMPTGPLDLDQPPFSFWIEPNPMASMLAQQDSFALSRFKGFPGKIIPTSWKSFGAML